MKIFIDFDDVIFYSKKFIQDEKNIFKINGVPEEIFKKYYYQYAKNKEGKLTRRYSLRGQLDGIKKELGISSYKIERELQIFLADTSRYVFRDSILFLEKFKKEELFLVSYSKTEFQKNKIENSGIAGYFKKIIITNGSKADEILKIITKNKSIKEDLFFVDDRSDYIFDVKKKIFRIKTILVERKEGRYKNNKNEYCDFSVKNLKEALKIIKK